MKISRLRESSTEKQWDEWHVLTVAESGFSMLDIFGSHHYGIDRDVIRRFEEKINATNESGSLHPRAPISAVPRKFFRDLSESTDKSIITEFKRHVADFIDANEKTIRASKILVEFHVSPQAVPAHFVKATEEVFLQCPKGSVLCEVIIAE